MKLAMDSKIKERSKEHFNKTASFYEESFDGKYVKPMYKGILDIMSGRESGYILDVGCGTGNILLHLVNGQRKLFGIDLSKAMIDIAKERLGNQAELQTADAENLPFPEGAFDVLICNASFHHYPHPEKVLSEMQRVLKKDGVLIIGEGYAFQPFRMLLNFSFRYSPNGDYRSYGKNELKRLVENTGFTVTNYTRRGMRIILEANTRKSPL
jgi:ubiquinone/menaquinone biosynthesis C-methylase UbiE